MNLGMHQNSSRITTHPTLINQGHIAHLPLLPKSSLCLEGSTLKGGYCHDCDLLQPSPMHSQALSIIPEPTSSLLKSYTHFRLQTLFPNHTQPLPTRSRSSLKCISLMISLTRARHIKELTTWCHDDKHRSCVSRRDCRSTKCWRRKVCRQTTMSIDKYIDGLYRGNLWPY